MHYFCGKTNKAAIVLPSAMFKVYDTTLVNFIIPIAHSIG